MGVQNRALFLSYLLEPIAVASYRWMGEPDCDPCPQDGLNTRRKPVANVYQPEVQLTALWHWMKEKKVSRARRGHRATGARPCLKNEGFWRPGETLVQPRAALGKRRLDTSHGWLLLSLTLALLFSPFPRHHP